MRVKANYVLTLVAVAMLAIGVTAWAKTYTMEATSIAPGAKGTLDAKALKSGENTQATLKVDNLAKPSLLTPPANTYVVWLQSEGGQSQNEGTLQVGDNEKGDITLTTTASKFSVFVTAENETHPEHPSNRVVLRTNVQE
jgi:hypothetical protein